MRWPRRTYGVHAQAPVGFARVRRHVGAGIGPEDALAALRSWGVRVTFGQARYVGLGTLLTGLPGPGGAKVAVRHAVLAIGSASGQTPGR